MQNFKKRSDNWSTEDKMMLKELIRERVKIIENKNTDSNMNSLKVAAWADLQKSFNTMRNGPNRTIVQLKSQWRSLKLAEKSKISLDNKERRKTGGGPPPRQDPTDSNSNEICAWLPLKFETDNNEFDSDTVNQAPVAQVSVHSLECPDVETAQVASQDHLAFDLNAAQHEEEAAPEQLPSDPPVRKAPLPIASPRRTRRRKVSRPPGPGQPAADIAACEIRCREELHRLQMENEERRRLNLDLKEQLLLTKIKYYEKLTNKMP